MHTPSLKKNIALNLFKTLLSLLFPLITFPYASRILLPEGIGKVAFARSFVDYFIIIATLGISTYGIRETAKVRDNREQLSKISREIITINMVSTAVSYILLFTAMFCISKLADYRALLIIISAKILFTALGLDWLYGGMEDYKYITTRAVVFQIISVILLFVFVHQPEDYLKYASIAVLANVGSHVCNWIHSKKYINLFIKTKLELKKHLKPIFILFAMAAVTKIYAVLDVNMLGFLCDDWQVGIYTAAVKVNKIVLSLVVAACTVLLPRLSYYTEKNETKKFNDLAYKGFNVLLMISIPSCIGLSLVSYHVIMLISGQGYIAAVPVMRIMNPIILIIGISNFVGLQLFMPLRKEKYTLYSVICGAVVNFSLNLMIIPKLQALGAAISTVCAEMMVTTVQLFLVRDIINLKTLFKPFAVYLFDAMIMCLPVFVIVRHIDNVFWSFIIGVVSGAVVYGLLLLIQKNEIVYAGISTIRGKLKW
jgi:O-antigen/teichoic acid export membrane protein